MEAQKPEPKSDDIDLGALFSRMGSGMRSAWLNFMRLIAEARRIPLENKLSFSLIIIASIIIGVVFSIGLQQRHYESKMIFSSDYLNKKLAENIIEKLDVLAREKTKRNLALALNLHDSVAKKIIGFDIKPFMAETDVVELEVLREKLRLVATGAKEEVIEEVMDRIEIENRHAYEITVQTLSPSVVSKLQDAIVGYLQKIPYIEKRVDINERNLIDLKSKLEKDINKMDSIKLAIYQSYYTMATQSKGSNNVILGDKAISDPVLIFDHSIDIYELYEEVSRDLYTKRDFEVIDGFTSFSEPANDGMVTVILKALIIGVFVAYADVVLRRFNKYLANLK